MKGLTSLNWGNKTSAMLIFYPLGTTVYSCQINLPFNVFFYLFLTEIHQCVNLFLSCQRTRVDFHEILFLSVYNSSITCNNRILTIKHQCLIIMLQ